MLIEPYSIREARIHIRRLRDLLVTMLEPNAFTATDNLSLSYCSAITEIDVEEEAWKAVKDKNNLPKPNNILPPSYAGLESTPMLEPVIISNYEVQVGIENLSKNSGEFAINRSVSGLQNNFTTIQNPQDM